MDSVSRRRKMRNMKFQAAPLVFATIIGLGIGLVIGWLAKSSIKPLSDYQQSLLKTSEKVALDSFEEDTEGIIEKIIKAVDKEKIKRNLKNIVSRPHLSGTDGDDDLIKWIRDRWVDYGLDDVQVVPYKVLLSLADPDKPNTVELIDKETEVMLYRSTLPVLPLRNEWVGYPYPYPYFSYAPSGVVHGEPVFVNYGTEDDYRVLKTYNVSVEGKIVIAKSGFQSCGKKISYAEKFGAIGLLVYPDPSNYAQEGSDQKSVYPHRWWLPEDGIVRASGADGVGDPSTPGYPSVDGAYHVKDEKRILPKIIAQPINYQDAKEILGRMTGPTAPKDWQGGMDIVYHIGPGFSEEFQAIELKITSYNRMSYEYIYNIIGTINGEVEPDRYVLIGNHRDAWVAGAMDPGSGTTVIMEIARIYGSLMKTGWRPKRTIKLALWGAEEFGLLGSVEWVEDNILLLQERAISYINVDTCVIGDTFSPIVSPTLKQAVVQVTKRVPDPDLKDQKLYDSWFSKMKALKRVDKDNVIRGNSLGVFSDFAPFWFYAGIPVMDISWQYLNMSGVILYPSYHTSYETIYYVEKFLDPGYFRHAACTQFSALMLHLLTDSAIIPFNYTEVVKDMKTYWALVDYYEEYLAEKNVSIIPVRNAMWKLEKATKTWDSNIKAIDKNNPFVVRSVNDIQLLLHKAFFNRDIAPEQGSWFFRYGIDKNILTVVNLLMTSEEDDSTPINADEVDQLLSEILIAIERMEKLLSIDFSNIKIVK